MIRVAVDTSTDRISIAIERGDGVATEISQERRGGRGQPLSSALHRALAGLSLTARDVNEWLWGEGPGSFTGLRVSLALLKGICSVTGAPIVPVPSPAAVAATSPAGRALAWAIDARRDLVYGALWSSGDSPRELVPVRAWEPVRFAAAVLDAAPVEELLLAGDGFSRYAPALDALLARGFRLPDAGALPTAAGLLAVARDPGFARRCVDADAVEPRYIRRSEAEEQRERRERERGVWG